MAKDDVKEKINYKVFSMRLDDRTWKKLLEKRIASGKSWNRFVLELLEGKKKGLKDNTT
jgi:hypothetical protein